MGLFELFIGILVLGGIGSLFEGSSNDSSDYSSDYSSYSASKGYHTLHNEADRNHGIALNNCENCRWHGDESCRWQGNCYGRPGKYHEYVCDNYQPK